MNRIYKIIKIAMVHREEVDRQIDGHEPLFIITQVIIKSKLQYSLR